MRKGLNGFVGEEINIYGTNGALLIKGVVHSASCDFVVASTHPDWIPSYVYICKRKLILKKLKGVRKDTLYQFFVKTGHNISAAPASGGFKY
mgnify:CR=1 FL=1